MMMMWPGLQALMSFQEVGAGVRGAAPKGGHGALAADGAKDAAAARGSSISPGAE